VTKVEEGTIDMQQITTFAGSDLKGQYALVMDGVLQDGTLLTRIGTLIPDGNGNLDLNEEANSLFSLPGTINDIVLSSTYQVSGNGRATSALPGTTGNIDLVMYMVSAGRGYVLQNDAGTEISGEFTIQTAP